MSDIPEFPDRFNMASYFVDSNIEAGRGSKVAIHYEGARLTYQQVFENVNRAGNGLKALGLQPEQRVLTVLHDRPEFVDFWFGAIKVGGVATQINPLLPTEDFAYYLNYTKAPIAAVDEEALPSFLPALKEARYLKHVIVVGKASADAPAGIKLHAWNEWLAGQSDKLDPADTSKDDPSVWLFTSGTTGHSKGAVHFHFHFPYNTEVYAKRFIGMRESDITVSGPRLFFGYATGTNVMFPFAVGATTVLFPDRPTPARLFELVQKHKCTVLTNVPTLINKMLAEEARPDLSSLRFMWSAGEALPKDLHEKWDAAFGVPIIDGIGSAESFHIYISNRPDDVRPGSLGKLVPGYTAKLTDDDGNAVQQGDVGTLWVGGDSAALYYHNAYAKSKEHLRGGWIVSGDKFRQDADGYWFYEGRGDDLIKSGGIYVSPLEVENCLMQHEAVKECCVIGKKDEAGLEKPFAIVVLNEGVEASDATSDRLIAHAKQKLVRYKAPHGVAFSDKPLPRNDRDKIDRKALRKEYA
ncbi:MAG: benzoate-CoA ligase family protein [Planctomycetes bacterium]|nr:benzoate-CoA ligase family protein [Planctomycetota bacterium]